MKKDKNGKKSLHMTNLPWKAKKYIAELVCVFVIMLSMVLSLCASVTHSVSENVQSRASGNYQMENDGTSVSLKLDSTQVKREEVKNSADMSKQVSQTGAKATGAQNRVVQDTIQQKGDGEARNVVVKNPPSSILVSTVFENYGELPELGDVVTRYQYPVEIGYAVDKNYDGRQIKKDTVLNMVMDTTPEEDVSSGDSDEEESTTEENSSETEKDTSTEENFSETGKDSSTEENRLDSQDEPEESDERVKFQKEIWSKLLMTEPVEVQKEEKIQVEEMEVEPEKEEEGNKEQAAAESEEAAEESTTEALDLDESMEDITEQKDNIEEEDVTESTDRVVIADAGYYIISGMMRDGKDAFVSDIQIKPSGVDGFDKVRLGKDGSFMNSVTITEEAADKDLELYFTDGERITTKTVFTYTKDTHNPEIVAGEEDIKILTSESDKIYCTNNPMAAVTVEDGDRDKSAGTERVSYVYGDKIAYVLDSLEEPKVTLPQDFFGRVLLNCEDKAGNTSDIISQYYLVDQNVPEVAFSDSEICTAPYTLWIDVADAGHIVSGIDKIECTVNGENYEITDLKPQENVQLTDTLEVPSKTGFSIPFDKEGSYEVRIQVTDHAGNITTEEKIIEVTQPELVAVYVPQEFTIHIDPQKLLGKEQIFSDKITLNNVSNVDVKVQIEDIMVMVNDEVSDMGMRKDCDIYLVAPDTGRKIKLNKGNNKDIYSYCLPMDAKEEATNLYFIGDTTEGSDAMWRDSDITISVKLSFDKWKE